MPVDSVSKQWRQHLMAERSKLGTEASALTQILIDMRLA